MNCQIFEKLKKLKEKDLTNALFFVLGVFLLGLVVSTAIDIRDKITQSENTLSVTATGEVYTKPDLALVSFSVQNEAKTVSEAMAENTKRMNAVIDFVKSQGVEEKDLKTTGFNIYPRYEWYEKAECIPPCPSGKRVLVGYEVYQSLEVKIRDMSKIGDIIQGATEEGANQVGNLQFTIDKPDEFRKQAREQAIEKAKTKAKELASQLGVNLIRISNFQESAAVPSYFRIGEAIPMGAGGEVPQIETGENKVEVTVTITYDIN